MFYRGVCMIMDNAIAIRPVSRRNRFNFGGYVYIGNDKYKCPEADVFIFNNPYSKVNRDLVFMNGEFYFSDSYGETMDRKTIYYVPKRQGSFRL